jgi:hypothetical protein
MGSEEPVGGLESTGEVGYTLRVKLTRRSLLHLAETFRYRPPRYWAYLVAGSFLPKHT